MTTSTLQIRASHEFSMIGPSPFAHRATTSVLSDEGRRLFCRLGLYGEEYAFLRRLGVPYELPSACAN